MNNVRRKNLRRIIEQLEELKADLEMFRDEENEYLHSIPENLQTSERYERAEESFNNLEDAVSSIEEAIYSIETATE